MNQETEKGSDENKGVGFAGFAELVTILGTSTKTNDKLDALADYFGKAGDRDKVWVIALFSGRKPKRAVSATQLQVWSTELTGYPAWLFEESYHVVGDLAETIALLLPERKDGAGTGGDRSMGGERTGGKERTDGEEGTGGNEGTRGEQRTGGKDLSFYLESLALLGGREEQDRKDFIVNHWMEMSREERFVFNKLITGGFRIGVSQKMMVNALAKSTDVSPAVIAHRISGNWDPAKIGFGELLSEEAAGADLSRPYPFYLAYALEEGPAALGEPGEWQAEWKWDGIRGQIIKRGDQLFVWSRGEELMTEKFPEYQIFREILPEGVVLDGEIIGLTTAGKRGVNKENEETGKGGTNGEDQEEGKGKEFIPLPFAALQTRIGRKNVTKKQLTEAPAGFIAYDLLEFGGMDQRDIPLRERRAVLEQLIHQMSHPLLQLSPVIPFASWEELTAMREQAREMGSEGLMLKRKDSLYQVGRKRGDWWKWKIDPLVIDAVMIYAQKGHGRRSNLYTDYTFAVRDGEKLVSFTKAYSGLTDKEFAEVDHFVKTHSLEKFGPVRTVQPELVFEIAFEGIAASARHKSGVALRFPRINRWRKDKKADEINTLEDLRKMLEIYGK